MAGKLFTIVVLAALAATVTAEAPAELQKCLKGCVGGGNPNDCAAECLGTTTDAIQEYQTCSEKCVTGDKANPEAMLDCTKGCTNDFQKGLKYPLEDVMEAMMSTDTANAIMDSMHSDNNKSSSDKVKDGEDNGASTVVTFTGSLGLSAVLVAYQLA
ncbi:hypothetical protein IWQ61_008921 [Dispira simplex]|nr:hypothetical protein IWQ61_008921 [Dispira simplex]